MKLKTQLWLEPLHWKLESESQLSDWLLPQVKGNELPFTSIARFFGLAERHPQILELAGNWRNSPASLSHANQIFIWHITMVLSISPISGNAASSTLITVPQPNGSSTEKLMQVSMCTVFLHVLHLTMCYGPPLHTSLLGTDPRSSGVHCSDPRVWMTPKSMQKRWNTCVERPLHTRFQRDEQDLSCKDKICF